MHATVREGDHYDALVVGAGFGGMGAALTLAEQGARVALCEALTYPGGCASTFARHGYRFEAGATLFSGFNDDQHMARLLSRHGLAVQVDRLDPVVVLRTPSLILPVDADRAHFIARLAALPGAPAAGIRRFFAWQQTVADSLWRLFDDPSLLPPIDAATLVRHLAAAPSYGPLLGAVGRPLVQILRRFGVADFLPLRTWLDAVCQITVQASAAEAEAPFALAAMDYFWRGTGHVRGGIGVLAHALCDAVRNAGGDVFFASRVRGLQREGQGWAVDVRGRRVTAQVVIANQLPQDLQALAGVDSRRLARLRPQVEAGWGACMLYLGVDGAGLPQGAHHLELVNDPTAPLVEGNHLFCSVSAAAEAQRAPGGQRTVTVSTHVAMDRLRGREPAERATRVAEIQGRMRQTLGALAPELASAIQYEAPGSPRSFARFTGRAEGLVGGIPRRAGLHHYRELWPGPIGPGLYMVGDTAFPGQSTLAAAIGGDRIARHAMATLPSRSQVPTKAVSAG